MGKIISRLFARQPFRAKLSRHVALRVFFCFVAIEVLVLIPSYVLRHHELQRAYVDQVSMKVQSWIGLSESELSQEARKTMIREVIATSDLLGIEISDNQGQPVLQVGDTPTITISQWQSSRRQSHYFAADNIVEVMVSVDSFASTYGVIARYDASQMRKALTVYVWRVMGAVLIMGLLVTAGVILILYPRVLKPIYRLREDLRLAGAAIAQDLDRPDVQPSMTHDDELGEVIEVFHNFVGEVYAAIDTRKKTESELLSRTQSLQAEVAQRKMVEDDLQKRYVQLQSIADSDALTQVANRRAFDVGIDREWRRMARNQTPLALIFLDVDFFKQYNDHYGHQMGDECLVKLAAAMSSAVKRPADMVARYGGEEFVVLLPETDLQGAKVVAQNIRRAILSLSIPHELSKASPFVTVSMGVAAQIPVPKSMPMAFITVADHALYTAKQQGRDRFCCAFEAESALM